MEMLIRLKGMIEQTRTEGKEARQILLGTRAALNLVEEAKSRGGVSLPAFDGQRFAFDGVDLIVSHALPADAVIPVRDIGVELGLYAPEQERLVEGKEVRDQLDRAALRVTGSTAQVRDLQRELEETEKEWAELFVALAKLLAELRRVKEKFEYEATDKALEEAGKAFSGQAARAVTSAITGRGKRALGALLGFDLNSGEEW